MNHSQDLKRLLESIDHKGYPAYKAVQGSYDFKDYILTVDHVQGDPFASPSKVSVFIPHKINAFPEGYYDRQWKKTALEDYLLRDGRANTSAVVERGTREAKRAELFYEVVETGGGRALLRIRLETGRHHQIRVQLAHAGMPIVGDRKYNFRENIAPSGSGLLLCSYKIGFKHPKTRRNLTFEIDKPYHLA